MAKGKAKREAKREATRETRKQAADYLLDQHHDDNEPQNNKLSRKDKREKKARERALESVNNQKASSLVNEEVKGSDKEEEETTKTNQTKGDSTFQEATLTFGTFTFPIASYAGTEGHHGNKEVQRTDSTKITPRLYQASQNTKKQVHVLQNGTNCLENTKDNECHRSNDNNGWTLVTRKKKNGQVSFNENQNPKRQHTIFSKHIDSLFQQRKCFRCFQKGHIKKECREPIRCHNCLQLGHIYRFCSKRSIKKG